MAKPFLKLIAEHIYDNYKDNVENVCIVLPNKRGALFLKQHLGQAFGKTTWLPAIFSAEDIIAGLSGLKVLEELDLMCHLYESYKVCYGEKAEAFDSFAKWGMLILQDFNEIDRYLADSEQLYENLKDIKVIENWSLNEEKLSEFQVNYLEFMKSLGSIYKHFSAFLLSNKWAYQGLAYKEAVTNLASNNYLNRFHKVLFCGFNALNAAELKIFNYLFTQKKADLLWDADEYYLNNKDHEAGLFLRKNFELFKHKELSFIDKHFLTEKNIEIISVPKQIGQAQVVKQSIQKYIDAQIPLDKVAVVLANEKLLWPVLQQLPESVEFVNITMEYPLRYTSTYALIDVLLQIQINYSKQTKKHKHLYFKDLVALLRQPLFNTYLSAKNSKADINQVINSIINKNISFISRKHLQDFFGSESEAVLPYFTESFNVNNLSADLLKILQTLQDYFTANKTSNQISLEIEYLEIFIRNLNRLSDVILKYPHFSDIRSFKQLFNQVVGNNTAPFIGEPLRGLQIMGVLETRTLDFEHLIFVNVNESVLPAGKSVNSFIPNDLKRAFGLPLYLEKDAIYSYHFYRLLQRAKNVIITYDSETDTFGKGEKSRFVTQLQLELANYSPGVNITETVASTKEIPERLKNKIVIEKNPGSLELILKKAVSDDKYSGLSPSALIVYKECGLKFYFKYGAGLKELKSVEESAESNTFGSILHLSLENIYRGRIGKIIDAEFLKEQIRKTETIVKNSFELFFETKELSGKNILQYEVIKVYVEKLIKNDISRVIHLHEQNQFLTLKNLEKEFIASIDMGLGAEYEGEAKPEAIKVFVKGKIDRIDTTGDLTRIIDYKNSIKPSDKFIFTNFEDLFEDVNYNKQFQLVMYAWLLYKNNYCKPEQMQPGIIPFKEFLSEPKFLMGADRRPLALTKEFFAEFENYLKRFIESIFNTDHEFEQTDNKDLCGFCSFNLVCNR
jgi:ATP-dependent helicase/nuclease subunit B